MAAARTFSTSMGRNRSISSETVPLGLATKSTAPSSIASNVASAPSAVSEEIITTGRGASIMIWPRQVRPSMPGIWISSVTTCGSNDRTSSSASIAIAGQTDVEVALIEEDVFEQLAHQGRIVGDQKLDHGTVTGTSSSEGLNLARTSASTWSSNCAGSTSRTIRPLFWIRLPD